MLLAAAAASAFCCARFLFYARATVVFLVETCGSHLHTTQKIPPYAARLSRRRRRQSCSHACASGRALSKAVRLVAMAIESAAHCIVTCERALNFASICRPLARSLTRPLARSLAIAAIVVVVINQHGLLPRPSQNSGLPCARVRTENLNQQFSFFTTTNLLLPKANKQECRNF